MNPFRINRIIKNNGLPMCIDKLCEKCGGEVTHRDVVMSDNFFYCTHCGLKRHYVKKITFRGGVSLLFRKRYDGKF